MQQNLFFDPPRIQQLLHNYKENTLKNKKFGHIFVIVSQCMETYRCIAFRLVPWDSELAS